MITPQLYCCVHCSRMGSVCPAWSALHDAKFATLVSPSRTTARPGYKLAVAALAQCSSIRLNQPGHAFTWIMPQLLIRDSCGERVNQKRRSRKIT
jgi:hypothetical protein